MNESARIFIKNLLSMYLLSTYPKLQKLLVYILNMNNSFASLMLAQFEAATSADDYMLPLELGAAAAGAPKARRD